MIPEAHFQQRRTEVLESAARLSLGDFIDIAERRLREGVVWGRRRIVHWKESDRAYRLADDGEVIKIEVLVLDPRTSKAIAHALPLKIDRAGIVTSRGVAVDENDKKERERLALLVGDLHIGYKINAHEYADFTRRPSKEILSTR
jgi:hypothetical protein